MLIFNIITLHQDVWKSLYICLHANNIVINNWLYEIYEVYHTEYDRISEFLQSRY